LLNEIIKDFQQEILDNLTKVGLVQVEPWLTPLAFST